MQKEIGQQRADNTPLRSPFVWIEKSLVHHVNRGRQPPLYIQENPLFIRMPTYGFHQKIMVDIIEESFNISFYNILVELGLHPVGDLVRDRPAAPRILDPYPDLEIDARFSEAVNSRRGSDVVA